MELRYSAGLTSKLFWGLEAKKTAKLVVDGLNRAEIKDIAITENLYQTPNEERSRRMFGNIYVRICSLGNTLTKMLANADWNEVKVINMLSILFTERFVFEFMYEVYRPKIIVADYILCDKDFNNFFSSKQVQSDEVARWTETTKNKVRQTILKMLAEGSFIAIDDNGIKTITPPLVSIPVENYLKSNKLAEFYYAMTGEK
ncbi:MAG: DUF1819 family protein [Clostridia bacterium]